MTRLTPLSVFSHTLSVMFALLLILASNTVYAASAVATVSQNVVPVGEAFQLTISVDDSVGNDALDLSPLDKDFIYGRPNISNSTSIINGSMTRSTVWRIAVAAKQTGTFTLPSFDIEGMKTDPITITVLAAGQKGAVQDDDAVKITATLDRTSGFIGETFNYRIRLMIGTQLDSPRLQAPSGDGFSVQQAGEDVQAEAVLNGRRYVVISRIYQITPTKAGTLTLNGAVFSATEVKGGRGWGPSLGVPLSREAETLTLDIKGKPADYQGVWLPTPSLALTQTWQPEAISEPLRVEVGEAINREITLKIRNIEQSAMPDLVIDYPESVRVYADKPEYRRDGDDTIMTVKQVIIPRESGTITLPALSINWFNTETEQQARSEIPALVLNVASGKTATAPIESPTQMLVPSIEPSPAPSVSESVVKDAGYWPWATAAFALLWLITLVLYVRKPAMVPVTSFERASANACASPINTLMEAVKANDTVKVASAMRAWDSTQVPETLKAQIDQEVNAMMASRYSKSTSAWQNANLLKLLAQANQTKKSGSAKSRLSELT